MANFGTHTMNASEWYRNSVMPALRLSSGWTSAGIHPIRPAWIPAYAGMTENEAKVFRMLGTSLLIVTLT